MINDFISLTGQDERRILDTLDFMNKHPETGSKEEYFEYIERFCSSGDRIKYTDGNAEVKLDFAKEDAAGVTNEQP